MKRAELVLASMQNLPEEARRMLAALSFIVSILLIFTVWNSALNSRLTNLEFDRIEEVAEATAAAEQTGEEEIYGPAEGLGQSLKSLGAFVDVDTKGLGKNLQKGFGSILHAIESGIGAIANSLFYL